MEIEKQRGISVTTSVMEFDYRDYKINILDTPGHQDFAEDTYRTLDGGRQCHHRGRWSEGCGNPDPQANGSLPDAENAGNHLCEQNGP